MTKNFQQTCSYFPLIFKHAYCLHESLRPDILFGIKIGPNMSIQVNSFQISLPTIVDSQDTKNFMSVEGGLSGWLQGTLGKDQHRTGRGKGGSTGMGGEENPSTFYVYMKIV
jgi:hypothetical protein